MIREDEDDLLPREEVQRRVEHKLPHRIGTGGKCPKCDAALSSDVGKRLDGSVIPLEQRSRTFGEPREAFIAETPPTLRPTADEAPAELLREWHRIQRDNWLFKAGDFRCADKAACESRYRAGEDVET